MPPPPPPPRPIDLFVVGAADALYARIAELWREPPTRLSFDEAEADTEAEEAHDSVWLVASDADPERALSYAETLRARLEGEGSAVWLLGSLTEGRRIVAAMRAGLDDYVPLPLSQDELHERWTSHLERVRGIPSEISHYEIVRIVGEGGMGVVFEARDRELDDMSVALKLMRSDVSQDPAFQARFEREKEVLARVLHENLTRFHEAGTYKGQNYLVMEYLEGQALNEGHWTVPEMIGFGAQIAHGLAALHAQGIVHRDIKPDNVIVSDAGVAKITDFGVAKLLEGGRAITQAGQVVGSPIFLAPEQFTGPASPKSDQYALGCTLFEALSGRVPFENEGDMEELYYEKRKRPPRLHKVDETVPRVVSDLIAKMMSPKPRARFSDTETLAAQLRTVAEELERAAEEDSFVGMEFTGEYDVSLLSEAGTPIDEVEVIDAEDIVDAADTQNVIAEVVEKN